MQHQSWNKAKRWLSWLGGCVVVSILAVCGFWYWINIPPQVKIPAPIMPQPNGYDYFLRAGAAFVPDEKGVDETTDVNFAEGKKYPLAPKEAWLKQNAKALQLLRKGFKYPALHAPVRSNYTSSPDYGQFRGLARALKVESRVRAERGDWRGAADSALDIIKFGYAIPRGGAGIANLIGVAVQSIGVRELGNLMPHLDAKTSRTGAARLERLYDGRFPYFRTMQEDKWAGQAMILEMMNEKPWRMSSIRILSDPNYHSSRYEKFMVLVLSKQALLDNYTKTMDAEIARARLPYSKIGSAHIPSRSFLEFIGYDYKRTRWNRGRIDTNSTLTMTMLALHAFHLEKGHYPASLNELVPEYLKKIPEDPFTGDTPLHYQLQGKEYLLWSIGSDGIDNHGTPIINHDKKGKGRYRFLYPESKGDVVAGITVP